MKVVLCNISSAEIEQFFDDSAWGNFCGGMHGIGRMGKTIADIRYEWFSHGNFNTHAIPNSVAILKLERCQITFALHVRALPRCMEELYLRYNQISGPMDLTYLPP